MGTPWLKFQEGIIKQQTMEPFTVVWGWFTLHEFLIFFIKIIIDFFNLYFIYMASSSLFCHSDEPVAF